jgi:hypothetical protein
MQVYVSALLIRQLSKNINLNQTMEKFLDRQLMKFAIGLHFPRECRNMSHQQMSHQNISSLSIQERIHQTLMFCGISDIEYGLTNDIILERQSIVKKFWKKISHYLF